MNRYLVDKYTPNYLIPYGQTAKAGKILIFLNSKNSAKNHFSIEYCFRLIYFKNSLEHSDFYVKILNFLWRSEVPPSTRTEPPYTPSNELLACVLWDDLQIFGKIKLVRGNFMKNAQQFGGFRPRTPDRIKHSITLMIFCRMSSKYSKIEIFTGSFSKLVIENWKTYSLYKSIVNFFHDLVINMKLLKEGNFW